MNIITVIPAYGRDYRSRAAVLADWQAGKDFRPAGLFGSGYLSQRDSALLLERGHTHVSIRYDKQRKQVLVPLSNKEIGNGTDSD